MRRLPIAGFDLLRAFVVAGLFALGFAVTGCGEKPAAGDSTGPLRIGMDLSCPPFEKTDTAGNPSGFSVDMAHDLGKELGREVQIVNMSFEGLIPALQTGKIDMIISSMTATAERAKSIAFSDPYVHTGLCMLVNKDSAVKTNEDLDKPSTKVVAKIGTTGMIYAQEKLKQANVRTFPSEQAAALEVVQGKADAFLYDQIFVYQYWQQNLETTHVILTPLQSEPWAVGLRQDDVALREKTNAFLAKYKASGGFNALADKYLTGQRQAFEKLGIPFIF